MMVTVTFIINCLGDCGKQVPNDEGTLLCDSLPLNHFPTKLGTGSSDDLYATILLFFSPLLASPCFCS